MLYIQIYQGHRFVVLASVCDLVSAQPQSFPLGIESNAHLNRKTVTQSSITSNNTVRLGGQINADIAVKTNGNFVFIKQNY